MSDLPIIILFIVLGIGFVVFIERQERKENTVNEIDLGEEVNSYEIYKKYSIPLECAKVKTLQATGQYMNYENKNTYMWIHESDLMMAATDSSTPLHVVVHRSEYARFSMDEIQFFSRVGDIQRGGKSLVRAVVGDILFGVGGAIVGSQKKDIDNRQTILQVGTGANKAMFILSPDAYDKLLKLIPTKEYNVIVQQEQLKSLEQSVSIEKSSSSVSNSDNDNFKAIEQLAELRNKGILTEEEFSAKKKQLLGI